MFSNQPQFHKLEISAQMTDCLKKPLFSLSQKALLDVVFCVVFFCSAHHRKRVWSSEDLLKKLWNNQQGELMKRQEQLMFLINAERLRLWSLYFIIFSLQQTRPHMIFTHTITTLNAKRYKISHIPAQ